MERTFNWKAALAAGLGAGLIFLILEMILVATVGGKSAWGPPRMMASTILGKDAAPPPLTFAAGPVLIGIIWHFVLSMIYGFVGAFAATRLNVPLAVALGGIAGLILYFINFYGMTALYPWFENARGWINIVTHIIFGLAVGGGYKVLQPKLGASAA